ncbi:hypothetical protein DY000_02004862, partial [Brassica cretica]
RPYFCRVEPEVFKTLYGIEEKKFNKEACSCCIDTIKTIDGSDSKELDKFLSENIIFESLLFTSQSSDLDKAAMEAEIWDEMQSPIQKEPGPQSRNPPVAQKSALPLSDCALTAEINALLWSVEAMASLRVSKVIFETSSEDLRDCFLLPSRNQSISYSVSTLMRLLRSFSAWKLEHVSKDMNRVASLIATSVTRDNRLRSYVAAGGPSCRNLDDGSYFNGSSVPVPAPSYGKTSQVMDSSLEVNIPKTKKTYCKNKECKKHTLHKVTQYKKGKDSLAAQGKRRYDRKQSGYGGQTKPVFHKKAKTTKKIVLRLQCQTCKHFSQHSIKRCKHFEIGGDKKGKGTSLF